MVFPSHKFFQILSPSLFTQFKVLSQKNEKTQTRKQIKHHPKRNKNATIKGCGNESPS